MTSTTLSTNSDSLFRNLYLWALRQHMGLSILFAILLFLIMPGTILVNLIQGYDYSNYISVAENVFLVLCTPLTMLFTLLFSALHLGYLHKKRALDLFYALPAKRNTLLLARMCAAATHVLLPLLANYLLMQILLQLRWSNKGWETWIETNAVSAICCLCLAVLASVVFSALIYVCSGTSIDAIVSIFVISGIYPVLVVLLMQVSEVLLTGLMVTYNVSPILYTLASPYLSMLSFYGLSGDAYQSWIYALWWIVFTVALLVLTLVLNRKRRSEAAETGWAFAVPNAVIRVAASATAGLGLGFLLAQAMSGLMIQFILGMAIGAFVMHMILEAVYSRGLRKWVKSLPYYGGTIAVLVCLLLGLAYGMNGIVNRVPAAEDVTQVECSIRWPIYPVDFHVGYYKAGSMQAPVLTEEENIRLVTQIQQEALQRDRRYLFSSSRMGEIELHYTLKDGTTLDRNYKIINSEFYDGPGKDLVEQLINSREFIEKANAVFQVSSEQVSNFELLDMNTGESEELLVNTQKKEELLDALKQDILEDNTKKREDWNTRDVQEDRENIALTFEINYGRLEDNLGFDINREEYTVPGYYTRTCEVIDTLEKSDTY